MNENKRVSDYTGLSICYFDDFVVLDKKNRTQVPKFINPVTAAIGRLPGQETSITKLYEFVKDLSKEFEIGAITTDQFQSRQLIQDLKRERFNAYEISVDRNDLAYKSLKLAIYENRIQLPQSRLLQRELRELQYSRKNGRGKVDHLETTATDMLTYGKGSKDCFTGDTKVLVLDKNKEVVAIDLKTLEKTKGDYSLLNYDYNGGYKESSLVDVFSNGEVTELVEIEMEDNYVFRCTPDHEILTTDGYKKAGGLTATDNIINLNNMITKMLQD